jgi:hypothetical protein
MITAPILGPSELSNAGSDPPGFGLASTILPDNGREFHCRAFMSSPNPTGCAPVGRRKTSSRRSSDSRSGLSLAAKGALRSNDPAEYEKAVHYNELVANTVMLQTVADQTHVIRQLIDEGYPVRAEDLERLSPYAT